MRKLFLTISIALVAVFAVQCRKVYVPQTSGGAEPEELIEMTLQAGNGGGEKNEIDGLNIKWKAGDKLYVVNCNASGNGVLGYLSAVADGTPTVVNTSTVYETTFSGFINKPAAGDVCRFYFVGDNDFSITDGNYTYDISEQYGCPTGNNGTGQANGYGNGSWGTKNGGGDIANSLQLMQSTSTVTITSTMLQNHNFGDNKIQMKSMMSISNINLKVGGTSLAGNDNDVVTLTGAKATGTLNVKTGVITPNNGTITLYRASNNYQLVLLPTSQTSPSSQSLTFTKGSATTSVTATVAPNQYYYFSEAKEIDMILPVPPGAINGLFSVAGNKQVYFSQGNLQYLGSGENGSSSAVWRFAENQWDYMGWGPSNTDVSVRGNVNINGYNTDGTGEKGYNNKEANTGAARDLFGWGTSNFDYGTEYYHPWRTYISLGGYGPSTGNLSVSAKSDWGWNDIVNGGNETSSGWRTLSTVEWSYLIGENYPDDGRDKDLCKLVHLNGTIYGIVILPDDGTPGSIPDTPNQSWLATNKAVFLPAAGERHGGWGDDEVSLYYVGSHGVYWSSTSCSYNTDYADIFWFDSNSITESGYRYVGRSVRLVRDVE